MADMKVIISLIQNAHLSSLRRDLRFKELNCSPDLTRYDEQEHLKLLITTSQVLKTQQIAEEKKVH